MKKSIKTLIIISIFIATVISTMIINIQADNNKVNKSKEANNQEVKNNVTASENPEYSEASIIAVGDILIHEDQLKAQFNEGTGEYNSCGGYINP